MTDYFVIATGTSPRQMHSVVEDVDELADRMSFRRISRSDPKSDSWILVDYVDVVVHLFSDNARQFYDLDNLWGDATRVQWK